MSPESQGNSPKLASQVGESVISGVCERVSDELFGSNNLKEIIQKLRSTNTAMGGVGISANQTGCNRRISLIHAQKTDARPDIEECDELVMINPVINWMSSELADEWEGCLSVAEAGIFAMVTRPKEVKVTWYDETGVQQNRKFEGFVARIIQHELAHLDGRVFLQEAGLHPDTLHSRSVYLKKKAKGLI